MTSFGDRVVFDKALTRVEFVQGAWRCAKPRRRDATYHMPGHWDSRLFTEHSRMSCSNAMAPSGKPRGGSVGARSWFNLPYEGRGIVVGHSTVQYGFRDYIGYDEGWCFIQDGTLPVVIVAIKNSAAGPALMRIDPAEIKVLT